jgi:hypothetical protein
VIIYGQNDPSSTADERRLMRVGESWPASIGFHRRPSAFIGVHRRSSAFIGG